MAPAKRRGGKAAACRQWRIEDLVLAKVKGFPAWPAKISRPEDWEHPSDPRKVFVHFFGTNEIGFCAPTDVQAFTADLKIKLSAKCRGKAESDFTRAVKEICKAFDEKDTEKQEFIPEIDNVKARLCIDERSKESVEKVQLTKDDKIQEVTDKAEEMLKIQKDPSIQIHYDTVIKKHDIKRERHRQENWQKTHEVGDIKQKPSTSLITPAKKDSKLLSAVQVGLKKHSSVPSKSDHMRSVIKIKKSTTHFEDHLRFDVSGAVPTSHFENHLRSDVSGAVCTIAEPELKTIKRDFKRSSESENNIHNGRENSMNFSDLEENGIQPPETGTILEQSMSEKQFGQKRHSMEKETRSSRLVPESEIEDWRKSVTDKSISNFESFKHGNTEDGNQVSNFKENVKGEKDFEHVHENSVPNDKDHVLSTSVTEDNEVRAVSNTFLHQNSILKKKRNLLKKHNSGLSIPLHRSDDQTKINTCTEEDNFFELLPGVDHRKKRTQIKGRKHKLNFDEQLHLVKRARVDVEDETKKIVEGSSKGGIISAFDNTGENTAAENTFMLKECHLRTCNVTSSNIHETEGDLLHGQMPSILIERPTCLPPKADKYRLRSSLPSDEAALPPSKRRHRAQEAMSACVAEAATASVEPMTTVVAGQDDACGISADERPYTKCFENDKKAVKGNEECVKVDMLIPKSANEIGCSKKPVAPSDPYQSFMRFPSEPVSWVEEKQVDPLFEDSKTYKHMDKQQNGDKDERNANTKMPSESSLSDHKMEEQKKHSMTAPVLFSPKKQNGANLASRQGNSISTPLNKANFALKGEADQYEYKSKSIRLKKSCMTPAKKSSRGLKKDRGKSGSEKLNQGQLPKQLAVRKHEQVSPIKSGIEPSAEKVTGPSKFKVKVNGITTMKLDGVSHAAELHLEKANKLRQVYDAAKEVKFRTVSNDSDMETPSTSLKHLIAAAQAKREQARSAVLPHPVLIEETENSIPFISSPSPIRGSSSEHSSPIQLHFDGEAPEDTKDAIAHMEPRSPRVNAQQWGLSNMMDPESSEEGKIGSERKSVGGTLSGDTEAAIARDTFEGMLETLSRTKESIGRASRHAIDCAKYGIAGEVVELIVRRLENEASFHRRIDLFFLVDSITQCSHTQKGIAGATYLPAVQSALPRLLGAAAPQGSIARENRRQCLKVLRLWLERRILPEPVLHRYMNEIGSSNDDRAGVISSRRPSRVQRAVDDPLREIEGMLDEYGSNTTFQLPGFLMPHIFEDDEEPSANDMKKDEDSSPVEAVKVQEEPTEGSVDPMERHRHILEDVDGELEMEDVSPSPEYDSISCRDHYMPPMIAQETSHCSLPPEQSSLCPAPPLPNDPPPSPPPLPASPPPPPPTSPPPPLPTSPPIICPPPFPQSFATPLNDSQLHLLSGNTQQSGQVVNNAAVFDSYNSSGFPSSQIHPGQNIASFNSTRPFEFLQSSMPGVPHGAPPVQQLQISNNNVSYTQHSYCPPPPTLAPSNQFSYVRAESRHPLQQAWLDSSPSPLPECEKIPAQEEQQRFVQSDRSIRPEDHLLNQQAGGCKTLCTSSTFGQEVNPGMPWPAGGTQYSCGLQLPAQNQMTITSGIPQPSMDMAFNTYSGQAAGLTGSLVAAPANHVLIHMSRSGISSANSWRHT